ncbi:DMT family transporter [Gynuella sunshinyii]|uniref:Permeases of the drug/metabolite transporter (DMT) superfamily n=1 Tax=Gynuella sunshinyii YC6258 TaxID=1445510 RepID=A0A0C5W435_9GAMM|nr:DMT family transporter [Gynuella sunshinyii]AJQ97384.1 permeases of the drug/metabolite transporter (DMT) superfamily [Gynuella sunshinyii YC6258]
MLDQEAHERARKGKGIWFGLAAVAIWTGFILVSRAGALSGMEMTEVVAVRFGTASIILLPYIWKYRKQWFQPRIFVLGSIGGLAYALAVYAGFERAPASHAALLLPGLMPVVIAILAGLVLQESRSVGMWAGVAVSTLGILVLVFESLVVGREYLIGDMLFVLACLCWGSYTVLLRCWKLQPWSATVSVVAVSSILYLPVYLFWLPKGIMVVSWQTVAVQAIYQGILATIVQMVLYVRAVQSIGATRMGALMALIPVSTGLLAVPLFGEAISLGAMLGMTLGGLGAMVMIVSGCSKPGWYYRLGRRLRFLSLPES